MTRTLAYILQEAQLSQTGRAIFMFIGVVWFLGWGLWRARNTGP